MKRFSLYLEADFLIRQSILSLFAKSGISDIVIERRSLDHTKVIIRSSRPGFLIGREGQNLKRLQKMVGRKLTALFQKHKLAKPVIEFQIEEVKKPFTAGKILAQLAATEIEKRLPVRRVMKRVLERARQNKEVLGIRVRLSGRLNGVEIHRTESLSWGKMPLGTLRSKIDYAEEEALCTYGKIGIKIWVYKGEIRRLDDENI